MKFRHTTQEKYTLAVLLDLVATSGEANQQDQIITAVGFAVEEVIRQPSSTRPRGNATIKLDRLA